MVNKKPTRKQLLYQKYVLIGAGLGLYFGIFFRPVREPSFAVALLLGVVATVVTVIVNTIQNKKLPTLRKSLLFLVQYILLMVAFEARHVAFDLGGKAAAIVLSTCTGVIIALVMAYNKFRSPEESV